ncbi:MAG: 2-oxoacid:acceptor oxidoreductase family protein [Candidatus Aenigmatarchaeota archaeon]
MKFNLVVVGYGGQGVLSLAEIIARAAIEEGYEAKAVEVHGLSQRGGALQCHVRFGEKVFSPLVRKAGADLIIALDVLEAWRACYYANKKTVVLTDTRLLNPKPFPEKTLDTKAVFEEMKKFARVEAVNASEIVEKLTGEAAMSNIFMLGYSINKKLLPIKKENAWKAVAQRIRPQFLEANKKVFEEAFKL